MLIDCEQVLLDLKQHLLAKHSHGQRDLIGLIAQLEVKHRVEEGLPERAIRLYGTELQEALTRDGSATGLPAGLLGDDREARSLSDHSNPGPEEKQHDGYQHRRAVHVG